jgi:hypothetical protein
MQRTKKPKQRRPILVDYQSRSDDWYSVSTGPIPTVNCFRGKWKRDGRKCERYNHVPHPTPANSDYNEWVGVYGVQIEQLARILVDTVDELHPRNGIKWDKDPQIMANFQKVIYHCSSKYLSPYVDSPSKEMREDE